MFFLLPFLLIFSQKAHGGSVSSETSVGSTSTVESLAVDGDLAASQKKQAEKFPWSASYSYASSQTTDSSGAAITDKTNTVNASLGYEAPSRLEGGAGYTFSNTPDENLVSLGPTLYLGYTFKEDQSPSASIAHIDSNADDDEGSTFSRALGLKLTLGTNRFVQTYTPTPPRGRLRRPITGINEITQSSAQLEFRLKAVDWLTIKPSYTRFSYNRDVAAFSATLSDSRISVSRAAFSNTISSLAESDASLSLTFYFLENWELLTSADYSVSASDQSSTLIEKAEISDNIGNFKIGLGVSTVASSTTIDTSGILDLSYDF